MECRKQLTQRESSKDGIGRIFLLRCSALIQRTGAYTISDAVATLKNEVTNI
jgi:hypothetical protein